METLVEGVSGSPPMLTIKVFKTILGFGPWLSLSLEHQIHPSRLLVPLQTRSGEDLEHLLSAPCPSGVCVSANILWFRPSFSQEVWLPVTARTMLTDLPAFFYTSLPATVGSRCPEKVPGRL